MNTEPIVIYVVACIHILFIIIMFIGTFIFSKKRQAEHTGVQHKNYILYYVCIGISAFVLQEIFPSSDLFLKIGLMFIFYLIVTIIFERTKRNVVSTIAVVVLSIMMTMGLQVTIVATDCFGEFRNYQNLSNVTNISVDYYNFQSLNNENYGYRLEVNGNQQIKKMINLLDELQNEQVDNFKSDYFSLNRELETMNLTVHYIENNGASSNDQKFFSYNLTKTELDRWTIELKQAGFEFIQYKTSGYISNNELEQ